MYASAYIVKDPFTSLKVRYIAMMVYQVLTLAQVLIFCVVILTGFHSILEISPRSNVLGENRQ